jgi:hypothetical protein
VSVIGEDAYLTLHSFGEDPKPSDTPLAAFQVRARSLLLALQAAIDDDQSPGEAG